MNLISRQVINTFVTAILFALCSLAEAQQPKKVPRIGFLGSGSPTTQKALTDSFRQGLRELGYVEGQNIDIDYQYAEARDERFAELAAELIRLKPDVIVTISTRATIAVKQATTAIPIVAANAGDLLGAGVVTSLAHPGGNVTGTTNTDPDFSAKRLALLKESFPELSRVAVLYNGGPGGDDDELKETQAQGRNLKVQVQSFEIKDPNQFAEAYAAMKKEHATALIIFRSGFTKFHLMQLLELATKYRLPTMCEEPAWADAGCLIAYGANLSHQLRRAALFVDKILKGAKPADLPVEQPMKFDLVINLKTAKQIGLTIPPNVLARADRVIR